MRHHTAILALALTMLPGCDRPMLPHASAAAATRSTHSNVAMSTAATPSLAPARRLGEYTDRRGIRRLYLLAPPGLSDAQLIDMARSTHAQEGDAWLWFLDSDEQAPQMLAALPETEKGDTRRYPGQWVEAHTLAHSAMQLIPGERRTRWVLYKGPYSSKLLTVLPCPPSDQRCQ